MSKPVIPRSEYPRPQFVRENWLNLNGEWSYEFDFGGSGMARELHRSRGFEARIQVPFCPESRLSGIGHTDYIDQMFYHRKLDIPAGWRDKLILLHFGGVDFECEGFIGGVSVGRHFGGSSSFCFDLTSQVRPGKSFDFVLRVRDDIRSRVQPCGKQSLSYQSAGCRYTRVTGIWQTVWLEAVNPDGLKSCRITPDFDNGAFVFTPLFFRENPRRRWRIRILANGQSAAEHEGCPASGVSCSVRLPEPRSWTPEDPFLYTIVYELHDQNGRLLDRVESYAGLRKVHIEGNRFFLNNQPCFLRLVLDQGFYEDGIWTAPSDEALKRDIELAQQAGFNGARLHQKVFEERYHYWADRLGFLTWGESASWGMYADRYTSNSLVPAAYWESVFHFLHEWKEVIERDFNHPSILVWTPFNETLPGDNPDLYRKTLTEVYDLTRQLDPTRPCNESSGFVHVKTDLWTVHLYRPDAAELQAALRPADSPVYKAGFKGFNLYDPEAEGYAGQPYILAEFGGFAFIPPDGRKFAENTWGYHGRLPANAEEWFESIGCQMEVIWKTPELAGFCYTQLTDVEQEQNGLYQYDRGEKISPDRLKAVFGRNR